MKKTIFALVAVCLLFMAACNDLEPTAPDLNAVHRHYFAPETTNNANGIDPVQDFGNKFVSAGISLEQDENGSDRWWEMEVNFAGDQDGMYDVFKDSESMTPAQFEAELKKFLKFHTFTRKDFGSDDGRIVSATTELTWNVYSWVGYKLKIHFTNLNKTSSACAFQVSIDPLNFTIRNGQKIDYNNDGKIDEYDTWIEIGSIVGTDDPDYRWDYTRKNYRVGLFGGFPSINISSQTSDPYDRNGIYLTLEQADWYSDTTDYASILNRFFKLQEFTVENGWQDTGTQGSYNTGNISGTGGTLEGKRFTFPITAEDKARVYRVRFVDYEGARRSAELLSAVDYSGVKQQLFGIWPEGWATRSFGYYDWYDDGFGGGGEYYVPGNLSPRVIKKGTGPSQNRGNDIYQTGVRKDNGGSNIVYLLSLSNLSYTDGATNGSHAPDPNVALEAGTLRVGYSVKNEQAYKDDDNDCDANSIVFFPKNEIKIEIVDSDENVTTASTTGLHKPDCWRITLPASYRANYGEGEDGSFPTDWHGVFFTPDVKSTETGNGSHFGNYGTTVIIPDEAGVKRAFFGTTNLFLMTR